MVRLADVDSQSIRQGIDLCVETSGRQRKNRMSTVTEYVEWPVNTGQGQDRDGGKTGITMASNKI